MPQRICVACRRTDAKRTLVRLVRDADARVHIDPTGKRNGRGAYLCNDLACWDQALRRHTLERALRVSVLHPDDLAALEAYARTLPPVMGGE